MEQEIYSINKLRKRTLISVSNLMDLYNLIEKIAVDVDQDQINQIIVCINNLDFSIEHIKKGLNTFLKEASGQEDLQIDVVKTDKGYIL